MRGPTGDTWTHWKTKDGTTLGDLNNRCVVIMVFLRHNGCTFCREAIDDISKIRPEATQDGSEFVLVHHGDARRMERLLEESSLGDVPSIHDPERALYKVFGLTEARLDQWLSPAVMIRGIESVLKGHSVGRFDGNVSQMPGVFILAQNEVIGSYVHQTVADRPNYMALLRHAREEFFGGSTRLSTPLG